MNQNIQPWKLCDKSKRRKIIEESVWEIRPVPNWEGRPHKSMRKWKVILCSQRDPLLGKRNKIIPSAAPPKTNCADKSKNKQIYKPRIRNLGGHIRMSVHLSSASWDFFTKSRLSLHPVSSPSIPRTQALKQAPMLPSLSISVPPPQPRPLSPGPLRLSPWISPMHPSHSFPTQQPKWPLSHSHWFALLFCFLLFLTILECILESKNLCYLNPCCLSSPSFAHLPSLTAPPAIVPSVSFSKVRTLGEKITKIVNERKS